MERCLRWLKTISNIDRTKLFSRCSCMPPRPMRIPQCNHSITWSGSLIFTYVVKYLSISIYSCRPASLQSVFLQSLVFVNRLQSFYLWIVLAQLCQVFFFLLLWQFWISPVWASSQLNHGKITFRMYGLTCTQFYKLVSSPNYGILNSSPNYTSSGLSSRGAYKPLGAI